MKAAVVGRSVMRSCIVPLVVIAGGALIFHMAISRYLAAMHRPEPLQVGFWFMALMALSYDLGGDGGGLDRLRASAGTMVIFTTAALCAHWVRDGYIGLFHSKESDEFLTYLGADYASALRNRIVGYEGAFGVALLTIRLTLGRVARRLTRRLSAVEGSRVDRCNTCGQRLVEPVGALNTSAP